MPPVTILSPYSGRPVKIREHDLGRALRDEQGRVFYVVEDSEHGRYAARTRKGSDKDLRRYRQIEAGVAKLDDAPHVDDGASRQVHDATGSKRRNPVGLVVVLVIVAIAVAAAGYVYVSRPAWLGLDADDAAADTREIDATRPSGDQSSTPETGQGIVAVKSATPKRSLAATDRIGFGDESDVAARVPSIERRDADRDAAFSSLPDGMNDDPEPVFVAAQSMPRLAEEGGAGGESARATSKTATPKATTKATTTRSIATVPIVLAAMQPAPTDYDDFHHTASGLRYKITHVSDGVSARAGNYLTVRYAAQTLDGESIIDDASQSFILAAGQAIRALDEGIAGIREGEQLRMFVPRGHSDRGTLPGLDRLPDEPFLLDVQLVSVRPGVTFVVESPGETDRRGCLPGDTIDLHYLARVEGRDEIIDATVARGQPMRFTLGRSEVIKGLELGVLGMRPGESRQLTIPPYLAYGRHSVAGGLIPENAVLSFRVTLVDVVEDGEE